MVQNFLWLVAIAFLTSSLGCNTQPTGGLVEGSLTLNGNTVSGNAKVVLMNMVSGAAAAAPLEENGRFATEEHLPPGNYVVFLVPATFAENEDETAVPKPKREGSNAVRDVSAIPRKYWDEATSPWSCAIQEGANQCNLNAGQGRA
ncbi:hypothetical protein AB1K70_24960 [Bremerella sp. JC770]|uniref:hypothetical protein n=1 Tax=Bremerella sp. JC770 TaxID=3232137 RepID=UPI003459FF69